MTTLRSLVVALPLLLSATVARAQTAAEKQELKSYRLSLAVFRQIDAATEAMLAEMKKDPRYAESMKLQAEIDVLEKKGEPTEAEEKLAKQIEALESRENLTDAQVAQLEKLQEQQAALEEKRVMRTDAEEARLEQLREQQEALKGSEGDGFQNAETLSDMEAAIRKQPAFERSLRAAGMAPREYAKFMLTMLSAGMIAGFKKAGTITDIPKELQDQVAPENVKFIEEHEAELMALQKKWEGMGGKQRR